MQPPSSHSSLKQYQTFHSICLMERVIQVSCCHGDDILPLIQAGHSVVFFHDNVQVSYHGDGKAYYKKTIQKDLNSLGYNVLVIC